MKYRILSASLFSNHNSKSHLLLRLPLWPRKSVLTPSRTSLQSLLFGIYSFYFLAPLKHVLLASGGFFSFGLWLVHALGLKDRDPILLLLFVTNSKLGSPCSTHLAASKSSVLWMASCSYFILHLTTSALPLEAARSSLALASCSSSYCSRRRSQSRLADCKDWAKALCDYTGHNTYWKKTPP